MTNDISRARREAPARGTRPTRAQRYALEFATTRLDGAIPLGTNPRTADVMVREGWLTIAPYRITDAGRAAIGEPTTAAVTASAERAADDAEEEYGCEHCDDSGRVAVHVEDGEGGYDGSARCPVCNPVPDDDDDAPAVTIDQAAAREGWFVVSLPAGPGTAQTVILADSMPRDDAHLLADVTRRAMRLGGNDYGVVWACPSDDAVATADRVADAMVVSSEHVHRDRCGAIDVTGDYPDCDDRCQDAYAVADDAVTRAQDARETLRLTRAGEFYVYTGQRP